MKKNKFFGLILMMVFLMSIFAVSVAAQNPPTNSALSRMSLSGVIQSIGDLAKQTIKLPGDALFPGAAGQSANNEVSVLSLLLLFVVLFSLFWAVSVKMKVFSEHKSAAKAFAIAISLLVVFFTPLAFYVQAFFAGFSSLMYIAVWLGIILLIYLGWSWFGKGFSSARKTYSDIKDINANSKMRDAGSMKVSKEAGYIKNQLQQEEKGIGELEALTRKAELTDLNVIKRLEVLLEGVKKADSVRGPQASIYKEQLMSEATNILSLESQEQNINNMIKNMMGTMDRTEVDIIRKLKMEKTDIAKVQAELKRRGMPANITDAKNMISNAIKFAMRAEKNLKAMEGLDIKASKYSSKIINRIKTAIENLRSNNFPKATFEIKEAIIEAKKEEQLLVELGKLEVLEGRIEQKDYQLVTASVS